MTMFPLAEARQRQRQLELRLRSAELRQALHEDWRGLEPPLRWADRGLQLWDVVRAVPRPWRLGGSALLSLLAYRLGRRRGVLRLLARALGGWRLLSGLLRRRRSDREPH